MRTETEAPFKSHTYSLTGHWLNRGRPVGFKHSQPVRLGGACKTRNPRGLSFFSPPTRPFLPPSSSQSVDVVGIARQRLGLQRTGRPGHRRWW